MEDKDKDEKIDISLSSLGDGENQNHIERAQNEQTIGNRFNEMDMKTAAKTKKIEEESDDEEYKKEEIDKTAQKMMSNPFKTHDVRNNS